MVNTKLLANISHELRTPLNAIVGMVKVLSAEKLTARQQECVSDIGLASYSLLSIINDMLDLSKIEGGQIELDEAAYEIRKCSSFSVKVPRVNPTGSASNITFKAPGAKALVVDDNELNLKVASKLLGLYDMTADMVFSGMEAIMAVTDTDYDVIFMDHMMPGMDGIEAVGKIRAMGGKFKTIPIIALTANAMRGVSEMFLANGFDGYLPKPIEFDKLDAALRKCIPPEKIVELSDAAPARDDAKRGGAGKSVWDAAARTGMINVRIASGRVAGIEEMYRETLEIFYGKMPVWCDDLKDHLARKDLGNFAITVHGLKSSLATIGAVSLSETAAGLEDAAKKGYVRYCEERLPRFLEELRDLQERLKPICGDHGAHGVEERPKGDAGQLRDALEKARQAAEGYDGDAGIAVIADMLKYDFGKDTNKQLKDIETAFRNFEFADAVRCISAIRHTL